jgi:macrolide-specific efflux system membrane fusion protein
MIGGGVYWFGLRDDAAAAETSLATATVAASLTTLEKSVAGSGTLTPAVQEDVSFEASGTVTSVDVSAGQSVTAGQTLATIDTLQLNADLLSAKATLASARALLAASEDDDDGSDAAEAQVAASAARVEVAQAKVDTAAEALAGATLVAPVAGLLTEVNLTVGQAVSTGAAGPDDAAGAGSTAHFVIVGTDRWGIDITVDDSEVPLIAVGDQAEITIEDVVDPIFGVVIEIGLISTSTNGVAGYPVSIEVTGRPDGVHDGVAADVAIIYERRTDVLTVPSAAVRTVDGASEVTQLAEDGTEVTTPVTVGETVGDLTEVVSGLVEGDEVVVTVVTQREQDGTGQMPGGFELPEGFDPSQIQVPDGFGPIPDGAGR